MRRDNSSPSMMVLARTIAAVVLSCLLSGCVTPLPEPPPAAPKEAPINSLALEQCIGENGQEKCVGDTP